ncbi:MAG: DNA polymerase subunit beta [Phycisphaera sp.]|nr:MAG: DNA polymerase subunit beta [Phycisphaera sp.]
MPSFSLPLAQITEFCKRWKITEFSLFGSILRDDFGPGSDVDVCVVFDPTWDHDIDDRFAMEDELSKIFGGRKIDIIQRKYMQNPFFRHRVLTTREVIYAA